ncbi:uncharacterized protein LOC123194596 isoform X2 [Mangifera indica]|uniref:uncharacterized protein LOC123194596 isoform X2 n=1 Tax=Mangifera indica TaxID=29780 RepID=UPI001CFB45B5|nr:uncharacterized protein LOC123194596 isoform X2 [Mangifera indica]
MIYMLAKARKKHQIGQDSKDVRPSEEEKGKAAVEVSSPPISDEPLIPPTAIEPVKVGEPISEGQQRELFKWMLEEKRKAKQMILEEKRKAKQMILEEKQTILEEKQTILEEKQMILDEKRKAEQKNWEEEQQIDEEKKILKQFIHAKSIPQL